MYALNQTIYEKKEIHSIITDGTIADINQVYQCKENSRYRSHYLLLTFLFIFILC